MKKSDSRLGKNQIYFISIFLILALGVISFYFLTNKKPKGNNLTEKSSPNKISEPPFINEGTVEFTNGDSLIQSINVEIADEDAKITQGMMYRTKMDENQGMIFIFPDEDLRNFWMKNTILPLDIIFVDKNWNVVSIQKYAIPYNETGLPSEGPAMYVVEVSSGFSDRHNIKQGTKVKFTPSRKLLI